MTLLSTTTATPGSLRFVSVQFAVHSSSGQFLVSVAIDGPPVMVDAAQQGVSCEGDEHDGDANSERVEWVGCKSRDRGGSTTEHREFFAGYGSDHYGLGYLILQTSAQLRTDMLFATILASALLGVIMFVVVTWIGFKVLARWTYALEQS